MSELITQKEKPLSKRYDSSHIEQIELYLANGGDSVPLNEMQQIILERLRFADEKIREGEGLYKREEIANQIRIKFAVSRDTAYKDIVNAERIFSSSFPLNKKYEIGLRIEFLKKQIKEAAALQDYKTVSMLEKSLLGYYQIYPDEKPARSKKNVVLNITQNNINTDTSDEMKIEDAILIAETISNE